MIQKLNVMSVVAGWSRATVKYDPSFLSATKMTLSAVGEAGVMVDVGVLVGVGEW